MMRALALLAAALGAFSATLPGAARAGDKVVVARRDAFGGACPRCELSGRKLAGAHFTGANFAGAALVGSDLRGAAFVGSTSWART
jgi:uncharacterized protein YjbI with pentapeptide repeats